MANSESTAEGTGTTSKSKAKAKEVEAPKILKGKLVSKLENPITLEYAGRGIRLSPYAEIGSVEFSKLGQLPKGVAFVPIN